MPDQRDEDCLIQDEKFGLAGLKDFSKGRENCFKKLIQIIQLR